MSTLRQLEVFVAVAEYKKMNIAAKELFISQPTVSQIISDLEEEYEIELFHRTPKELQITAAGLILLNNAKQLLNLHIQLDQSMKSVHSNRPLRVGATLTIGNTIISRLVSELEAAYPDIDVSVFVDNTRIIEHRIMHNELDIALVEGIIRREEIETLPVIEDNLKLICGPSSPFWDRDSITIKELENQIFILRECGSGTRATFENIMTSHFIPYTVKWECSSGTAIIDAVRHNLGIGVLSERCISEAVEKGDIHSFSIDGICMNRSFSICYNKNFPITSQMKQFIDFSKKM